MHARMCSNAQMRSWPWTHLCALTETILSAHLCCAAWAYNPFPSERRAANGTREGERSWLSAHLCWLSHQCLERQVAVETRRVHAVSIRQQLQKPTTERVLLATFTLNSVLFLSLLGNWQADQFTCIIRTRTMREVINYGQTCADYIRILTADILATSKYHNCPNILSLP